MRPPNLAGSSVAPTTAMVVPGSVSRAAKSSTVPPSAGGAGRSGGGVPGVGAFAPWASRKRATAQAAAAPSNAPPPDQARGTVRRQTRKARASGRPKRSAREAPSIAPRSPARTSSGQAVRRGRRAGAVTTSAATAPKAAITASHTSDRPTNSSTSCRGSHTAATSRPWRPASAPAARPPWRSRPRRRSKASRRRGAPIRGERLPGAAPGPR